MTLCRISVMRKLRLALGPIPELKNASHLKWVAGLKATGRSWTQPDTRLAEVQSPPTLSLLRLPGSIGVSPIAFAFGSSYSLQ